jgi:hypothetical protein
MPEVQAVPLLGKKYAFVSTRGTCFIGLLRSKVSSNVEVSDDRLLLQISPKKYEVTPEILFENIVRIDISAHINIYYWVCIILTILSCFSGAVYMLLFTAIFIYCGLQRKITITQRNGVKVVMYTTSKEQAEEFKADMKTLAKIQEI